MFEQRSLKHDLAALGLVAFAAFLGLSLATYNPADPPSSLVYPPNLRTTNACGRAGALAADLLLAGLGVGAYSLAGVLLLVAVLLLARRSISDPWLRGFGGVVFLVGFVTLASMALPGFSAGPVIGAGGYLGAAGRGLLEMHFARAGAYLLTLSVLGCGVLLSTDYMLVKLAVAVASAPLGLAKRRTIAPAVVPSVESIANSPTIASKTIDAAAVLEQAKDRELAVRISGKPKTDDLMRTAAAPKAAAPFAADEQSANTAAKTAEPDAEDETEEPEKGEAPKESTEQPAEVAKTKKAKKAKAAEVAAPSPVEEAPVQEADGSLRIKKPGKNDRQEVMQELDAASRAADVRSYELPDIDLLLAGETICYDDHEKDVRAKAKVLEKTFLDFGFRVKVVEVETGPVIAQFEVELEAGLRLSKITSLADDLAIALRVPSVRIVAPIPGKNTVGIEVPNAERQLVRLREVIEESNGVASKMRIPIYLGKDVSGKSMVVDLTTLPHLLIAGRTGTGKSVCLNSIIVSMLMTRRPDEVRMLMIDPKMVELSPYKTLPHLMHPVVTDMRKAEAILAWAVEKMEERYSLLARAGVRHISVYNQLGDDELMDRLQPENDEERKNIPTHLPYIVIVADEMADLMMTAAKEVEQHIIRLAQKSRAVGIHLVLATQKPTVDVITGLIKSNLPARIAFQVASRTDSRVVLDEMGADKLLGNGDMLFLWPGTSTLLRGQGTYVTDDEINRVVDFVGAEEPQFVSELMQLKTPASEEAGAGGGKLPNRDELYEAAVDVVVREGRGSVSLLQRALGIGYGRAARLVDFMAEDGIVGDYNGSQAREVLISIEQWAQMTGAAPAPAAPEAPRNRRVLSLSDSEPAADVAKPARAKRNKSTASAAPKTKATAGARENMEDEETEDFARSPGASAADDDWDDDAEESEIDAGLDDEAALDADHDDASYTEEDEDESSPFATRNDDRDENDDHHERDDADHGGSPRRSLRTRAS